MQLDAVTIAVIAGIVAVLLLATAAARRGGVDRGRGPFSSSTESQAGFAALGTTNPAARGDDEQGGHGGHHGHDHGGGHSHGGGDVDGGHGHGGDAGGGDDGGGDGDGD